MIDLGLALVPQRRAGGATSPFGPGSTMVFALMGQSNMVGRAMYDGAGEHPPGVLQWGRSGADDGELIPASVPLQHVDAAPGQMGLDITFADAALAAYPDSALVVVPLAEGGTGFANNDWNPGDVRFQDSVTRINAVMAANPGFTFAGFLWHQGESDTGNATYQTALDTMIAALRADVDAAGPTTPFILGGLSPDWIAQDPARETIQSVIETTTARVSRTAVADSSDLAGSPTDPHFSAANLRMLGTRYWEAWQAVFNGQTGGGPLTVGTIPDQSDPLALAAPQTIGVIPDQTDLLDFSAPQAIGTIPNQEDALA